MKYTREKKFRAFDTLKSRMFEVYGLGKDFATEDTIDGVDDGNNAFMGLDFERLIIIEYIGIKDKNVDRSSCIYEGDILSLYGIIIGNIHENKEMAEGRINLVIEGFGTRIWRVTEEKAMDRGCSYSK